ncbi:hypothetical protein MXD59_13805 [Frankia sp. Ag45/Mut15]|uniref:Protein kinase domain-containing protein n=1 Tax=Frankia umida TaxID=573489 RepID=A0ABT0JZ74_9ACTN|nr:hypothetical protein [Frankia umida]MCK9876842.1 hypothetical protein [Frankia umida]
MRSNDAGGRHDFEQMVTSLVDLLEGPAYGIEPAPGDWGIDVYTGDLTSHVRIWQVKYFINGVRSGQLTEVRKSFDRACAAAAEQGHRIDEWTLCIPVTMDGPRRQAFERWRADEQRRTAIPIRLWDETRLRTLLSQPACAGIRTLYYGRSPAGADGASGQVSVLRVRADDTVIDAASPTAAPWQGGQELSVGGVVHLLHDPVVHEAASDGSWVLRDATARELGSGGRLVRLRHLRVRRGTPEALAWQRALRTQADLLATLRGTAGLPALLARHHQPDHTIMIMSAVAGRTWREVHGTVRSGLPTPGGPDRIVAARVLADAAALGRTIAVLHRHGQAHRRLSPDTIVMPATASTATAAAAATRATPAPTPTPRDLGLVGMNEVDVAHEPGAAVDVRQLATLVLDALGGRPSRAGCPDDLDHLLTRAVSADPRHRPRADELVAALRDARHSLSLGTPGSSPGSGPDLGSRRPGR